MHTTGRAIPCACRMEMELEDDDDDENEQEASDPSKAMYVKYDRKLHGPKRPGQKDPLSVTFLKKFIKVAKNRTRCVTKPIPGIVC